MTEAKKLWQVGQIESNKLVENFLASDDTNIDQRLIPFDVEASKAHANMLQKISVLTKEENKELQKCLDEILVLYSQGKFTVKVEQEDCHTAIEEYLTAKCGESGKKIHTGRSRNDQVLVAMRLLMRQELETIKSKLDKNIDAFSVASKKFESQDMPGYTHYQKAMPTTVEVWLLSFRDALSDILPFLKALENLLDQNPLGSASGFGIRNFTLDREQTARELGFSRVQENPIYCGFSRGYFENIFLQTLSQIAIVLSRLASDLLLFSTSEFDFIKIPTVFTTGSSIMPQKRNPDTVEIMQGKLVSFLSKQDAIQNIIIKLSSGYHREFQLVKKPFFEGVEIIRDCLEISAMLISGIDYKSENLEEAMTKDLFVTEKVYDLVKKGLPFREAYRQIKKEITDEKN